MVAMVAMVAIDGRTRIASSRRPTPRLSCENFFCESLARGVAMVATLAIDDRTRIASSRRQAEAREWCTAWLRVRGPVESACAWLATTRARCTHAWRQTRRLCR